MAVIDVCTFNREYDLFDIRYNILKDYVDEFRVIEFDRTFSNIPKEPTFFGNRQFWPKVKGYFVPENIWSKYMDLAKSSLFTKGADHWKIEFCQKESIKDCLKNLKDDDIVFIGDCDEIWFPQTKITQFYSEPYKCKLLVYIYYLNNRSSEEFWGLLNGQWGDIKNKCLNHLRSEAPKIEGYRGWHFTSLKDGLKRKLEDSYTKETYANDWVMQNLEKNIMENKDFLGRDFKYWIDESEWPQYLKDNRKKYEYLCKENKT